MPSFSNGKKQETPSKSIFKKEVIESRITEHQDVDPEVLASAIKQAMNTPKPAHLNVDAFKKMQESKKEAIENQTGFWEDLKELINFIFKRE